MKTLIVIACFLLAIPAHAQMGIVFADEIRAIQMLSTPGCAPCERWKTEEKPKYEKLGWLVQIRQAKQGPFPRFMLRDRGVVYPDIRSPHELKQVIAIQTGAGVGPPVPRPAFSSLADPVPVIFCVP